MDYRWKTIAMEIDDPKWFSAFIKAKKVISVHPEFATKLKFLITCLFMKAIILCICNVIQNSTEWSRPTARTANPTTIVCSAAGICSWWVPAGVGWWTSVSARDHKSAWSSLKGVKYINVINTQRSITIGDPSDSVTQRPLCHLWYTWLLKIAVQSRWCWCRAWCLATQF